MVLSFVHLFGLFNHFSLVVYGYTECWVNDINLTTQQQNTKIRLDLHL